MKDFALRLCLFVAVALFAAAAIAQEKSDTLYVFLENGSVDIFPRALLAEEVEGEDSLWLTTLSGQRYAYAQDSISRCSDYAVTDFPRITSFKLNNKFNDQIYKDVECTITDDSLITAKVGAIGKWVTPSFKRSNKKAVVYADSVKQTSKHSKIYMDGEKIYSIVAPGVRVLQETDSLGCVLMPYKHDYRVQLTWKTDKAKATPTIRITTSDLKPPSSKETYVDAVVVIEGGSVFPSMEGVNIQIKGRGNTSWSNTPTSKNPYNIKFSESVSPLGLKKGKKWVLQANRQTQSMMTNPIAMKIGNLVGAAFTNDYIPVDLYMNNEYWGSYGFTQKLGLANNSVDLEDETKAVLLELDLYYDADYKFKSTNYNIPVNVKDPDLSETTEIALADIKTAFNTFEELVYNKGDFSEYCDVEALSRYFMVTEFVCNREVMHPKSMYVYCENICKNPKFVFGPLWDYDWAYGYNNSKTYCDTYQDVDFFGGSSGDGRYFIKALRWNMESVDRCIYKIWTRFLRDDMQELLDFCDAYYAYAKPSFKNNKTKRGDNTDYAAWTEKAKKWLQDRAANVYASLTPYELTDEELYGPIEEEEGEGEGTDFVVPAEKPIIDAVQRVEMPIEPTSFDVYTVNGVRVKHGANYRNLRDGLAPGLYIVNGKKVLF